MANAWLMRPLPMTVLSPLGATVGSPAYLANDYMGVVWGNAGAAMVDAGGGSFYHAIDFDLGSDIAIDTIIALGMTSLPAGSVAQLLAATAAQGPFAGGGNWTSPGFAPYAGEAQLPSGELTLQWSAPLNGTPPAARYLRLLIFASSRFYFQMRRVLIGRRFAPSRNFSNGAAFGVRDLGSADFSRRGVLLRARGAKLRTVGLTFTSLYQDELEQRLQPMLEYLGNTEMAALVTDPDPHAQRSRRTYYGPLVGEVGSILRRSNAWQASINLVSLI